MTHDQSPARLRRPARASTTIRPEHVAPAVDVLLAEADARARDAPSARRARPTTTRCRAVLDVATERLGRAWGAVGHLNAVADTPELRAAYNENLPRVTEFQTRLGADERLYAKYKAIAAEPGRGTLTPPRRKALRQRAARLRAVAAPSCRARRKERFAADPGARRPSWRRSSREHVLDATDALRLLRRATTSSTACPTTCVQRRARRREADGKRRLQAHAADARLPAGDAVRARPRAARDAVPRLRHARQRARPARARQQPR